MSTRDLGKHIVELHEEGMLAIAGEGVRQTLSPREAFDFLNWLDQHHAALEAAAKAHMVEEVPEELLEATRKANTDPEEIELTEDEP